MDDLTRAEAQRMAREAIGNILGVMYDRDPRTGYLRVRYGTITPQVVERLVDKAVGADVPITRAMVEAEIAAALR